MDSTITHGQHHRNFAEVFNGQQTQSAHAHDSDMLEKDQILINMLQYQKAMFLTV